MFSLGGNLNRIETEPKFNYSKANWRKDQQNIQNEVQISTTLHNPIAINKHIRSLNYIILNSAKNSITDRKR